jgi:DNA polymerase I
MPKKLFLVDGSNHAFRVQYALPPRHASDGFPTRLLYGFTLLFQKMMRTYRPDYCAVSFDVGKTFRHDMYSEYKAKRKAMPEDMRRQWPLLPDLVRGFGYPCMIVPGFEADDVLGTLAKRFASPDVQVYLVTGDKDFTQLVNEHIHIIDERKDLVLDVAKATEKMGVPPEGVIDLLGLAGDASDNVPGVPGVGAKTAEKLLQQWGTMEGVLAAAAEGKVKGKRGENLVNFADKARLSRTLVTIDVDVPMDVSLEDLGPQGIQAEPLRELFDKWDFGMVARKLLPEKKTVDTSVYTTATTDQALDEAMAGIRGAGRVAFDLVTTSKNPFRAQITGIGLAWGAEHGVFVPLEDRPDVSLDVARARDLVRGILANKKIAKLGNQTKAARQALTTVGWALNNLVGDTRLLSYTLMPHRRTHNLDDLSQRHLGHNMSYRSGQAELRLQDTAIHAIEPAHLALLVHDKLAPRLEYGTKFVYERIELPLVPVLAQMERTGIRLDVERLAEVGKDIEGRLVVAEERCHELAGRSFNVGSTKEVATVLFEELELPVIKKTKTGYSTDHSVLEALSDKHDLPSALLEWRSMSKLVSTYLKKLPTYVAEDGRIHTTFNQAVAATGRLSSTDPNLQNIPIRTFEGRRIRDAFIPAEGHLLLSADYSQVELRVLAHFCGSTMLVQSFTRGEDIHRRTASEVFDVPMEDVSFEQRSAAKAVNFGLLYGMSAFRLGRDLAISRTEAQQFMDDYFGRMPEVQGWLEDTRQQCRSVGYVETLFGRRRVIPEIYSKNFNERSQGEREAVNTRVQGTAADIIKIAMIRVDKALSRSSLAGRMLLQVHDELLLEVPADEVEATTALLVREMEGAANLIVPLRVNSSPGSNWNEAHG